MNKRIFSLVCIFLYVILVVPIRCSQQEESDVENKRVRDTKEINRSNEKNDIEYKCKTQSKNNNNYDTKDYEDGKGFNCFNIFKRNKKNKRTKTSPYSKAPLIHSHNQITETSSNNNESLSNVPLQMETNISEFFAKNPELLKILSGSKKLNGKLPSNFKPNK
ncbi:Plasmodium yoelii subtelomeric region (PYST-C1), putative [Plasmodium chabaudi adami]|uniref:Plasmodium yoelii subtelomeric region (PYST-C1), putative n=1 Tax=Plasmodium chabaudi adami TaxID=5826 RepID=A0A1D3LCX0_PLACE|nr:Plasmodium yoelii subtelomeric region (PYST-C1), putative [Plasmodium chabaudi adami]